MQNFVSKQSFSEYSGADRSPLSARITPPDRDIQPFAARIAIPLLAGSALCLLSVPVGLARLGAFEARQAATAGADAWARFFVMAAWPTSAVVGPILAVLVYVFRRNSLALLFLLPTLVYDLAATVVQVLRA